MAARIGCIAGSRSTSSRAILRRISRRCAAARSFASRARGYRILWTHIRSATPAVRSRIPQRASGSPTPRAACCCNATRTASTPRPAPRQASDGASALAAAEERAAVEGAGACGASVWDAQALLRVLAGEVHGANEERGGGVVQGASVQLAARGRVERVAWRMGRGVLRPSAVRGTAKPLNWGRAGAAEAASGGLGRSNCLFRGRGTAGRGDARVMQRSPKRGEDAANAAGEGTADGAQRAPSFLRRQESIRRDGAIDGAAPRLPTPPDASSFPRSGNLPAAPNARVVIGVLRVGGGVSTIG